MRRTSFWPAVALALTGLATACGGTATPTATPTTAPAAAAPTAAVTTAPTQAAAAPTLTPTLAPTAAAAIASPPAPNPTAMAAPAVTAAPAAAATPAATTAPTAVAKTAGPAAPDLAGNLTWFNSAPLTLGELRGKTVLLVFWSDIWPECRSEVPTLRQWHQAYKGRGFELIAVHGNDYPGQLPIADAVRDLRIDYPVAHDEAKATWRAYNIRFRPSYVLIGPDGAIAGQGVGLVTTDAVKGQIEALLKT